MVLGLGFVVASCIAAFSGKVSSSEDEGRGAGLRMNQGCSIEAPQHRVFLNFRNSRSTLEFVASHVYNLSIRADAVHHHACMHACTLVSVYVCMYVCM